MSEKHWGMGVGAGFLALLCWCADAHAVSKSWNVAAGNWNTAGNWNPSGVPASADDVTITGGLDTITIDTNVDVNSILVDGTSTRTIQPSGGETIRVRGNLTLSSTSAGGTFRLSSATTRIGGQLNRSNNNMTLAPNGGTVVFDAASGAKTHTLSGASLNKVMFNDGLVSYWSLDENTGTTAADSTLYGHTATFVNSPTWSTAGPSTSFSNTSALSFDGTNASASVPDASDLRITGDITIAFWMKRAAATSDWTRMVGKGASMTERNYGVWTGGDISYRILFQQYDSAGGAILNLQSTTALVVGTWYHVACTVSGSTAKVYVDGNLEATGTRTGTPGTTADPLTLGYAGIHTYFNGLLDEVRIYDRALSNAEVAGFGLGHLPATSAATHSLANGLTVTSDLTILSGAFGNDTNSITVGGSWLNHGGIFSPGTGVVTLNGSGASILKSGQFPFSNLGVTGTGTWTLGDRLWIDGALTMSNGTIDQSSRNHGITTGTVAKTGGVLTGGGNLVFNATTAQTVSMNTNAINSIRFESPKETGLVGYWKLDGDQGLLARDATGGGHNGSLLNGARWGGAPASTSFDNPASVFLDGVDDSISVPDDPALRITGDITIAFWMKRAAASSDWTRMVGKGGSMTERNYGVWTGGDIGYRILCQQYASGGASVLEIESTTALVVGTWYHVACTISGSTAKVYVNGNLETTATRTGTPGTTADPLTLGYAGFHTYFNGLLDDVRVYNRALSASEVASQAAGRYASGGGGATFTLGSNLTANGVLAVDSGTLATSSFALNAAATDATQITYVNAGALSVGSGALTFKGGLTVQPQGALTLASSGGSVAIASGKSLIVDGTLNASSTGATIQSISGNYAFQVGSTATARPTLNITGVAVKNTDSNGLWINAHTSAVTTFTRFDDIAFSAGTGAQLLQIYASSLYLSSNGCTFDGSVPKTTTYSVTLTSNGTGDGETRAVFGGASCASNVASCQASKLDDDADGDGVGNTPATNGAVVQFIPTAVSDTTGSIEGFPAAAFDWNTFTYYSTYVVYHDASGTADRIYLRGQDGHGKPGYATPYWDTAAGETLIGGPRWNTVGGTHYVYVATTAGKVYRLVDNTSAGTLLADNSGNWAGANNPFDCGCTIATPLSLDADNLYWGGTQSAQKLWTLGQASRAQPFGSPITIAITGSPTVTSAVPALWSEGGTTQIALGLTGHVIKLTSSSLVADNNSPGAASVLGRISIGGATLFAGDDGGTMRAINLGATFSGAPLWTRASGAAIRSSAYYDHPGATLHYGTDGGNVYAVAGATGVPVTGYPYALGGGSDAITTAPVYTAGVLVVGSSTGRLHFIDRNNGTTGPALIRAYYFGPTQAVSGIGYDPSSSRFMVSTADPSAKDGRLYYFDAASHTDPTAGTQ